MATAWPTGDELIAWVGQESASPALTSLADEIMEAVTSDALERISVAAIPSSRRPGESNPDCPAGLRQGLIMAGGRTFARRASQAGFQVGPDVIARITNVDPDVEKLLGPYTNWPEA